MFLAFYQEINHTQHILGWGVFAREAFYVVLCGMELCVCPVFFLVDPWDTHAASHCTGWKLCMLKAMYVLQPEKYVGAMFANYFEEKRPRFHTILTLLFFWGFFIFDCFAVGAFCAMAVNDDWVLPLAVGYFLPCVSWLHWCATLPIMLCSICTGRRMWEEQESQQVQDSQGARDPADANHEGGSIRGVNLTEPLRSPGTTNSYEMSYSSSWQSSGIESGAETVASLAALQSKLLAMERSLQADALMRLHETADMILQSGRQACVAD